ncbi:multiple C2 and transmembrane domain-containing protein 1-like [Clavelina lepadiformis]|uniref:multiple C2 and transmembrane domain-containing protein 1-like n=1 Tax=Clavelina lepadiformis TaxID=159417 RepID=UPI004042EEB6
MLYNDNKSIESDADAVSLTESVDSSPTRGHRCSKKMKLFSHRSHKKLVREKQTVAGEGADNDIVFMRESESTDVVEASFSKDQERDFGTIHKLHVKLLAGEHLAARDSNGLSDPYVKFKLDDETVYKSKCCKLTLNPKWNEEFTVDVHLKSHLRLKVYDKDSWYDDFMGGGSVDFSNLEHNVDVPLDIHLEDPETNEELGYILLSVRLFSHDSLSENPEMRSIVEKTPLPVPLPHQKETCNTLSLRKNTNSASKGTGGQLPVAFASVQLVSGSDLPARSASGTSDPYVKLLLGRQKRKSKCCSKTLDPVWKDEFLFHLHSKDSPAMLDISVWNRDAYRRDDSIGRCELDLMSLECEVTHSLSLNLVDTQGTILLLVTIHEIEPSQKYLTSYDLSVLRQRYGLFSTLAKISDIGFVEIRIASASGLRPADFNGKSDPFCVVQFCNARAQTQTCYKTLDPVWNRVFTFPVCDIHDVFEITVYDEDSENEKDFLGKIVIPILSCNNGDTHTYTLKDKKLKEKTKGTITVQISYIFNQVRAAIRTFSPREEKFMEESSKFKKSLLVNNFSRVWSIVQAIIGAGEFFNSCFTWENRLRSVLAFIAFVTVVWNFEVYMLPFALLLLLMKNYVDIFVRKIKPRRQDMSSYELQGNADDEEDDEESSKLSFMQRLRAIEEVLCKVQTILDLIASFGERVYNTVTWSVPFLAWVLMIVLVVACFILYLIPLRIIILAWGINKFSKRLRNPNYVPNNEVMDYLSRIPSNVQLLQYQESALDQHSQRSSKKKK